MTARVLAGAQPAARLREQAAQLVSTLSAEGVTPRLAILVASTDEPAAWYVRSIGAAAARLAISCAVTELPPDASAGQIAGELARLSADPRVHGIILPAPVPAGLRTADLAGSIDPAKDVDGASPLSLGRLTAGLPAFAAATARAVVQLLDWHEVPLAGCRAVIVGRSLVVGKPLAQLLLARDATVTMCHSRTADLARVTAEADVLVAAAGRAGLITGGYVRPGAVVVDVGTNPGPDATITGDVDADAVAAVAGALSPVPGGVGPVTTAQLLLNVARAAAVAAGLR